ncbi:hypothetical protein QEG73_01020 [Chitinophagaceae bacterium 26-R-25]|nr:hypothetical protein [Chitinophagaceae bacterium 26-R-25]
MKRIAIACTVILLSFAASAQVASGSAGKFYRDAKEYSKNIALFNSKRFLFTNVFGLSSENELIQFEVIPLAAATSGELTTLLYKCDRTKQEGLVLGFYGSYCNSDGSVSQGYAYKNLEKEKATAFLNIIQNAMNDNDRFLTDDYDNNNIYFSYDNIDVLICKTANRFLIRLFWNGFDSNWDESAFKQSKKQFESKLQ